MHLVADLSPALSASLRDTDIATRAQAVGLQIQPLSSFFVGPADRQGLVLGYAAFTPEAIDEAVKQLVTVLESV